MSCLHQRSTRSLTAGVGWGLLISMSFAMTKQDRQPWDEPHNGTGSDEPTFAVTPTTGSREYSCNSRPRTREDRAKTALLQRQPESGESLP
ncbi:hypothetical protein BJX68DRAFT_223634 [Aspergillus pseudodeflectus]|uniref:Secreted protein n=1 Tax=Aspergillus pseudodeflectus TaxID=176178 RepID=A0ABR4LF20_9EURO